MLHFCPRINIMLTRWIRRVSQLDGEKITYGEEPWSVLSSVFAEQWSSVLTEGDDTRLHIQLRGGEQRTRCTMLSCWVPPVVNNTAVHLKWAQSVWRQRRVTFISLILSRPTNVKRNVITHTHTHTHTLTHTHTPQVLWIWIHLINNQPSVVRQPVIFTRSSQKVQLHTDQQTVLKPDNNNRTSFVILDACMTRSLCNSSWGSDILSTNAWQPALFLTWPMVTDRCDRRSSSCSSAAPRALPEEKKSCDASLGSFQPNSCDKNGCFSVVHLCSFLVSNSLRPTAVSRDKDTCSVSAGPERIGELFLKRTAWAAQSRSSPGAQHKHHSVIKVCSVEVSSQFLLYMTSEDAQLLDRRRMCLIAVTEKTWTQCQTGDSWSAASLSAGHQFVMCSPG